MEIRTLIDQRKESGDFTQKALLFVQKPELIPELCEIALSDEVYPYPEYASWLLFHVGRTNPDLLRNYQSALIDKVLQNKNQTILRNLTNCLASMSISDYREGEQLDKFLFFLQDPESKVALQVISLKILMKYIRKYPEIKPEIDAIIELISQNDLKPSIRSVIRSYKKLKS